MAKEFKKTVRGGGWSHAVARKCSCINSRILQNIFGPFPYSGVGDWLVRLDTADKQLGIVRTHYNTASGVKL